MHGSWSWPCEVSRHISLYLTPSLSTSACLACLSWHIGVYGQPKQIRTDNFSSFKRADKNLEATFFEQSKERDNYAIKNGFKWVYSIAYTGWYLANVESLIRRIKAVLYKTLQLSAFGFFDLLAFLQHLQLFLNQRPLACTTTDSTNDTIISPSTLVFGRNVSAWDLSGLERHMDTDYEQLWKNRTAATKHFNELYQTSYLDSLMPRKYWNKDLPPAKINDVFMVMGEESNPSHKKPANQWAIGRVSKLLPSKDGKIRSYELVLADSSYTFPAKKGQSAISRPHSVVVRAAQQLIRLPHLSELYQETIKTPPPSPPMTRARKAKMSKGQQLKAQTRQAQSIFILPPSLREQFSWTYTPNTLFCVQNLQSQIELSYTNCRTNEHLS